MLALKHAQIESFPGEALLKKLPLPLKNKLFSLTPLMDKAGLLYVGGGLCKDPLPEETHHPVIFSAKHDVLWLVILYHHLQSWCAGMPRCWRIWGRVIAPSKAFMQLKRCISHVVLVDGEVRNPDHLLWQIYPHRILNSHYLPSHTLEWITLGQSL